MNTKGCIAMVLAGGRGRRLGALTSYYPKSAIHFGGRRRIIDFTLGNCKHSGISTVGLLSQHFSNELHNYIKSVPEYKDFHILSSQNNHNYYTGTADAVYKNIDFIERFNPEYVLILDGANIYKMDYSGIIYFHKQTGADVTVASATVPMEEASRFGIIDADNSGCVRGFEDKPRCPRSNRASMGIYVFKWCLLKKYLVQDNLNKDTHHDFRRDILPEMLRDGKAVYTYRFNGYWRDIGTVSHLLETQMDQIDNPSALYLQDDAPEPWGTRAEFIYYSSHGAEIYKSVVAECCSISGRVKHSVLCDQVTVGRGAEIVDSYIMPGAYIGNNAKIYKTVVGTNAIIMDGVVIGDENGSDFFIDGKVCTKDVSLVAPWLYVAAGLKFQIGSHIYSERLMELTCGRNMASVG